MDVDVERGCILRAKGNYEESALDLEDLFRRYSQSVLVE